MECSACVCIFQIYSSGHINLTRIRVFWDVMQCESINSEQCSEGSSRSSNQSSWYWRWQYGSSKSPQLFISLHGVTSQNIWIFRTRLGMWLVWHLSTLSVKRELPAPIVYEAGWAQS